MSGWRQASMPHLEIWSPVSGAILLKQSVSVLILHASQRLAHWTNRSCDARHRAGQFAFTHPEEFAPVRFISKGDSGIEPLQDHPNKDTLASEVLNREVPVPVFTSLGFSHYNHYTVEEILANGENETGEDENGNPLRIRDYMPADGLLILHEGKIVCKSVIMQLLESIQGQYDFNARIVGTCQMKTTSIMMGLELRCLLGRSTAGSRAIGCSVRPRA